MTGATVAPVEPRIDLLQIAAYHEIGHLVAAEVSGIRAKRARIQRTLLGGVQGCTELDLLNTPGVWQDPNDHRYLECGDDDFAMIIQGLCLCDVAGWRAVAHWFRLMQDSEDPINGVGPDYGNSSDIDSFRTTSRLIRLSTSRANAMADKIIAMHWTQIDRAARVLYRRKQIQATEVVKR